MSSFLHYPQHFEVIAIVAERDKMKVWEGNFMYFILYLTYVLAMTNYFALPPNF